MSNLNRPGESRHMTRFRDTPDYDSFIASADSRNTSPEIMEAIGFFARDLPEAEAFWEDGYSPAATLLDLWERVTGNGQRDASRYLWGASESHWADGIGIPGQKDSA